MSDLADTFADGRLIACTRCGTVIRVHELPGPFIDADLFIGRKCGCEGEGDLAPAGVLEETREYDPWISQIPF